MTGIQVDALVGALTLEPLGDGRFRGSNLDIGHGVVFGGQLLGQAIVAAQDAHRAADLGAHAGALGAHAGALGAHAEAHDGGPDMATMTLHVVFARAGRPDAPMDITVEPMQAGRSMASSTVTLSQGDRLCARALVLLTADEPDHIRHADPAPDQVRTPPAEDGPAVAPASWEVRVVDDVDVADPDQVGPPDLDVWTRFPGAPEDPVLAQALLAFATDSFLIGTAMRPHAGVGQAQAHVTLTTGVLTHTLTFHEPAPPDRWLLLSHHSDHAGRGRTHGQAQVFRQDGQLAASFVQDALVRAKGEGAPAGGL